MRLRRSSRAAGPTAAHNSRYGPQNAATITSAAEAAASYASLAPYYDRFTSHHKYESWTANLEEIAIAHGLTGKRLLDVACGTGKSFIPFSKRGYEVTACDLSTEMLAEARAKAPQARLKQADMRELEVLGTFDLVTCLDDSLNYLLEVEELKAALAGLARNLAPQGVCLFDLNTLPAYRSGFAVDEASEVDGVFFIWRGEADENFAPGSIAQASIEVFEPVSGSLYKRSTSRHRQRHYPPELVCELLSEIGLHCVATYAQLPDGSLEPGDEREPTHKTVFVARHRESEIDEAGRGGESR
jgi:ubiquinone/menaquinone biosynthesis C-methylase UbiE